VTTALDAYEAALEHGIYYDIIIMDDSVIPGKNDAVAVRKLRDLGFRGFIICVTEDSRKANLQNYIAQGANKVFHTSCCLIGILESQDGKITFT